MSARVTRERAGYRLPRSVLVVLLILGSLVSFASSVAGGEVVETVRAGVPVSAFAGLAVWSTRDAESGLFFLVTSMDGGAPTRVPVAPRRVPFDVDAGRDAGGQLVVAYSRCQKEPFSPDARIGLPAWSTGRGCSLYRFGFADRRESKIRVAASGASEYLPTIFGARVAFVRTFRSRHRSAPPKTIVYVSSRGRRAKRLPGGPREQTAGARLYSRGPGPTVLDLGAFGLAINWASHNTRCVGNFIEAFTKSEDQETLVAVDDLASGRQTVVARACDFTADFSVTGATLIGRAVRWAALRQTTTSHSVRYLEQAPDSSPKELAVSPDVGTYAPGALSLGITSSIVQRPDGAIVLHVVNFRR